MTYRSLGTPFALGGVIGALVGYLIGTPPTLSFFDVLTRGGLLQGIEKLNQPAAAYAFNLLLAGTVVGVVGGMAVAYLTSVLRERQPPA